MQLKNSIENYAELRARSDAIQPEKVVSGLNVCWSHVGCFDQKILGWIYSVIDVPSHFWIDVFPFPKVGYVSSLEGSLMEVDLKIKRKLTMKKTMLTIFFWTFQRDKWQVLGFVIFLPAGHRQSCDLTIQREQKVWCLQRRVEFESDSKTGVVTSCGWLLILYPFLWSSFRHIITVTGMKQYNLINTLWHNLDKGESISFGTFE